jgi:hypothetical protein
MAFSPVMTQVAEGQQFAPGMPLKHHDWVMHYATTLLAPGYRFHSIQNVKFQAPLLPETSQQFAPGMPLKHQRHRGFRQQRRLELHVLNAVKAPLCSGFRAILPYSRCCPALRSLTG